MGNPRRFYSVESWAFYACLGIFRSTLRRHQMTAIAPRISGQSNVCSTICPHWQKRKFRGLWYCPFVRGIHRWLVDSPHKRTVTPKIFPFDDVIMELHGYHICWCHGYCMATYALDKQLIIWDIVKLWVILWGWKCVMGSQITDSRMFVRNLAHTSNREYHIYSLLGFCGGNPPTIHQWFPSQNYQQCRKRFNTVIS